MASVIRKDGLKNEFIRNRLDLTPIIDKLKEN